MKADGHCRSCGKPIRWAVHFVTRKRIPLDPQPVEDGNIGVVEWIENVTPPHTPLVVVGPHTNTAITPYRYVSHFASCPHAATHRKRR